METGNVTLTADTATKLCDLPAGGPYSVSIIGALPVRIGFTDNVEVDGVLLPFNTSNDANKWYTFTVNSIGEPAALWAHDSDGGSIGFLVGG